MPKCFVIMPISMPRGLEPVYRDDAEHFSHVLEYLFVPALEKAGFEPVPPKVEGADVIHASIVRNIESADLVLCDMSTLNPNVFFELGIRTAVNKAACIVVDDVTEKVPFDTSIINRHVYSSSLDPWVLSSEIDTLTAHITATNTGGNWNSLWRYFGLTAKAQFSGEESSIEAKVDIMSIRLDAMVNEMNARSGWRATEPLRVQSFSEEEVYDNLGDLLVSAGCQWWTMKDYSTGRVRIDCEILPVDVKRRLALQARNMGKVLEFRERAADSGRRPDNTESHATPGARQSPPAALSGQDE